MKTNFSIFNSIQLGALIAVLYFLIPSLYNNGDTIKQETEATKLKIVAQKKILKEIIKKEQNLQHFSKLLVESNIGLAGRMLNILNAQAHDNIFRNFLSNHAKNLDLSINSLGRINIGNKKKWETQSVDLTVGGGYHQLMEFIAKIQSDKYIVILEKISLNPSSGGGESSKARLQANLSIKLYQFILERKN